MMQIIDVEQGTDEWLRVRAGVPTASEFSTVLAEPRADGALPQPVIDAMVKQGCSAEQLAAAIKAAKKKNASPSLTRRQYMHRLAGEIITGEITETYKNAHMERGNAMEAEARDYYSFINDVEPQRVGFVLNGRKGCSPDSLIGDAGALEIKTQLPHLLIDTLLKDQFPPEHKAQCQGVLWVAEREWIDISVYWPKMPAFVRRAYRDEVYIATLATAVSVFNEQLDALVEKIKALGEPVPAPDLGFGFDKGGTPVNVLMAG